MNYKTRQGNDKHEYKERPLSVIPTSSVLHELFQQWRVNLFKTLIQTRDKFLPAIENIFTGPR